MVFQRHVSRCRKVQFYWRKRRLHRDLGIMGLLIDMNENIGMIPLIIPLVPLVIPIIIDIKMGRIWWFPEFPAGLAHLCAASADGAEAAREPRCLGVPWREAGEGWKRRKPVANGDSPRKHGDGDGVGSRKNDEQCCLNHQRHWK